MPVSAPPQAIPPEIVSPPDIRGGAGLLGETAYRALRAVDERLIPSEVVDIARRSLRFAEMRPAPGRKVETAIAEWRQAVAEAAADPSGPLPSYETLVQAIAAEEAAKRISGLFGSTWNAAIAPAGRILAAHADQITLELKPRHTTALAGFRDAVQTLDPIPTELGVITAGPEAIAAYESAGHHLSAFVAIMHCRVALDKLPKYRADIGDRDLLSVRNPEAARAVKLPKSDNLLRWRALLDRYVLGDAWCPSRAEVESLAAEQDRARREQT